jgi:hypothetical protein
MDDTSPPRPTLALKVIGLLVVFSGVDSVCTMVAGLFLGSLDLNLGVLLIPVGIGLLKLHPWARKILLFLYYLAIGIMAVVLPVVLGLRIFGPSDAGWSSAGNVEVFGKFIGRLPWWLSTAGSVVGLGVFIWTFVVLRGRTTARLFEAARDGAAPLSRGLLVGVLLAVILGTVPTVGGLYVRDHYPADDVHEGGSHDNSLYQLVWGYRWGRLAYIVYHRVDFPPGTTKQEMDSIVGMGPSLKMPGQPPVELPGPHFMYNCINGQWRASDFRVTDAEFEAFRESHPDDYSIEALTDFVRRLRQRHTGG